MATPTRAILGAALPELREYIETLERVVLRVGSVPDGYNGWNCYVCDRFEHHAPDCLVPPLLAKYEESS